MKSELYFKRTGSHRLVAVYREQITNDYRVVLEREMSVGDSTHKTSVVRMIKHRIINVHACKADHYFDVVY